MSDQLAEAPVDFDRMIRTAHAHIQRARTSSPSEWHTQYVDSILFSLHRLLPEHESEISRRERIERENATTTH